MVLVDEHADMLLQGMNGSHIDDKWHLDMGASSHMSSMKTFYESLDESHKRVVRFGDGSSIRYEGKGEVHVDCTNGERLIFENVFYIPNFKTNILSLGKLDSQGGDIRLRDGFLTLHGGQGRLLTKIPKTRGNMYLLKLNIVKHCLLVEKNDEAAWLWYRRMCHQSAHTLHGMMKGNHAIGLPSPSKFEHKCNCSMAAKHARALFPSVTEFRVSKPLELVYADICGPITPSTINGGKYF